MVLYVEEAPTAAPLSVRKLMRYFGPGLLMAIAYVVRLEVSGGTRHLGRHLPKCGTRARCRVPLGRVCAHWQDPGNLESDLQTGATTGYSLLWLLGATTLMVRASPLTRTSPRRHWRVVLQS